MKRILTGVVLAVMLTGGAAAGPFEDGHAALKHGDYATITTAGRERCLGCE
jgi:hypothetical protein